MTEDITKPYGFLQSRTIIWLLTALVAKGANLAVAHWGLPLPQEVQDEAVSVLLIGLDALLVFGIAAGMWFRVKARTIIGGWRAKPMAEKGL